MEDRLNVLKSAQIDTNTKYGLFLMILNQRTVLLEPIIKHDIPSRNEAEKILKEIYPEAQKIKHLAWTLGFTTSSNERIVPPANGRTTFIVIHDIVIGTTQECLETYKNAWDKPQQEFHYDLGILFGYPLGAVDWFARQSDQSEEFFDFTSQPEIMEVIERENLRGFLHFWLSPNNWQGELEAVIKNKNATMLHAPWLFENIISEAQEETATGKPFNVNG